MEFPASPCDLLEVPACEPWGFESGAWYLLGWVLGAVRASLCEPRDSEGRLELLDPSLVRQPSKAPSSPMSNPGPAYRP